MNAAKACALLYSFQGEAITGDEAELPKIAALVGMNAQQAFAKVAQLKERDLDSTSRCMASRSSARHREPPGDYRACARSAGDHRAAVRHKAFTEVVQSQA